MVSRLFITFQLIPFFVFAQEDSPSLLRSFDISYQNDLLAASLDTTTDYYYTGGTFIEFRLPCLRRNPVSKILLTLPNGNDESFGISYNNLAFTPTSIKSDSILSGDRPFAGTLYLGLSRASCNSLKQLRMISRLDVGLIGPGALAYETQKFIHAHTNNPEPHGWQFQVAHDVYVNYSLRVEKGLLAKQNFVELIGYGVANVGTIYSNARVGLTLRAGKMNPYFLFSGFSHGLQLYCYASAEAKAIGRDATLQGGMFSESDYVIVQNDIERLVFSANAGIVIAYHSLRIEYFNTWLSREFATGKNHMWGNLGVNYVF